MNLDYALAVYRGDLVSAASRWHIARRRRRRRLVLLTGAIAASVVVVGVAAAASGWLTGTPAPESVKSDFGSYTPQLGFHPQPGSAVLVASDGDSRLYATTDAEGSYCIAVSTPWRDLAEEPDGGTCISKATSEQPIVAGLPAATADEVVLAGRVSVAGAVSVALTLPDRTSRTVPLGSSGFFITNIQGTDCEYGSWTPRLIALDSSGTPVAATTIQLEREDDGNGGVPLACVSPDGPTAGDTPSGH